MRGRSRKLLSVLIVLVALPVVLLLVRSAVTLTMQRRMAVEFSGRYVRQLARYGAARFVGRDESRVRDFLELLHDRGYMRALTRDEPRESREARDLREERTYRFIPGMLAYIRRDGTLIAGSEHAEILPALRGGHPELERTVTGTLDVDGLEVGYCLCVWPTEDPDVLSVAMVTLLGWGGGGPFTLGRFVNETMFAALFCLFVLLLLRRVLIRPLRALADGLSFGWGREVPAIDARGGSLFGLQVEEIASLREAIVELAREAVKKAELEKRYVGDIVKAQEDERNRLAREIHDGPIQVVAALMQRIQMASLSLEENAVEDTRTQLALAEEAARNVVEDLRGVCDSLVPPWVSLGLARCMEEMAARLARQHDVTIDVDIDLFVELPQEKTLALFRIFQEGVSNAVRHGRAKHIALSVNRDESSDAVTFVLQDDGVGFDPEAVSVDDLYAAGRRGLAGMRQRIEGFGGTWKIDSEPGEGATVEVRI